MGRQFLPSLITIFLLSFLRLAFAWKLTIIALIVTDIKTFPLVWHLRLLNALRFVLPSQRAKPGPTSDSIFQPLITSSHCSLSETDFNWHKSNSTYYSDLDIARTHLLSTLFSTGIDRARHGYGNGLLGVRKGSFTIKLGAVRCSFKREIRPYQRYEMWTRVLSWESKWLYTMTHFVRQGSKSGEEGRRIVCASAISKCVFKAGRRTIPPAVMLSASGLLPRGMVRISPLTLADGYERLDGVFSTAGIGASEKDPFELDTAQECDLVNENGWSQEAKKVETGRWTTGLIESERQRGMGIVNEGDLDRLEDDFDEDADSLAWHLDL